MIVSRRADFHSTPLWKRARTPRSSPISLSGSEEHPPVWTNSRDFLRFRRDTAPIAERVIRFAMPKRIALRLISHELSISDTSDSPISEWFIATFSRVNSAKCTLSTVGLHSAQQRVFPQFALHSVVAAGGKGTLAGIHRHRCRNALETGQPGSLARIYSNRFARSTEECWLSFAPVNSHRQRERCVVLVAPPIDDPLLKEAEDEGWGKEDPKRRGMRRERSLPLEREARTGSEGKYKIENAREAIPHGTEESGKRRERHAVNPLLAPIAEQRARYYYRGCTL